jgi:4a-hydroxytetrahydrobiopterin dehydratase
LYNLKPAIEGAFRANGQRCTPRRVRGMPEEIQNMSLSEKHCIPCKGGVPPLKGEELHSLAGQVPGWQVVEEHHLQIQYKFPDFAQALAFVNRVGAVAEAEGHHPDLELAWGRTGVKIWTHKIDGLTESDFIMAAKIDRLYNQKEN